jgi:hypothetical protein
MVRRINPPLLEFGDGKRLTEPIRAFAQVGCSLYKVPVNLVNGIEVLPIVPESGNLGAILDSLLADFRNGLSGVKYSRNEFRGLNRSFGMKAKILGSEKYSSVADVRKILDKVSRNEDLDRLIVAAVIPEATSGCGDYQNLKIHCIHNNIRSQFFTGSKLTSYESLSADDKGPFIWNVSLGFLSKLECVPWRLLEPLEGIRAAIGLNTVVERIEGNYKRVGISALQIWNDWGECIGSFHTKHESVNRVRGRIEGINPAEINEILEPALARLSDLPFRDYKESGNDDSLTIHISDWYSDELYDAIVESITDGGYDSYKIISVSDRSSHFQYDPSQNSQSGRWPWAGTWDYIIPNKKAYFYTAGAWKYYSGSPFVISPFPVFPLEVNIIRGSPSNELTEQDLVHVYQLTRLAYYSSDIVRLKTPVTIKLGRRGAKLVQCGLNSLSIPVSFLY